MYINTIVPIFVVIAVGVILRRLRFLPPDLLSPLNRLVYYLAIPAMIFHKVSTAAWETHFQPVLILAVLVPVAGAFLVALGVRWVLGIEHRDSGSFIQSSFHGNLGYIGLAVCFYALGDEGLTRASILAGFLMLMQNVLAVGALLLYAPPEQNRLSGQLVVTNILFNPVIISALAGIMFSLSGLDLPVLISRSLGIISGMALPLALMVIGASLSFHLLRRYLGIALGAGVIKLFLLPGFGLALASLLELNMALFAPALLLLAAPTATVAVVMAGEISGSPDFASAAVALNTLLSAVSYSLWLSMV